MKREIKFRAWYQNRMHYKITKHHFDDNELSGFGGDVWDFADWLKYSIVQQYTGLKDKNGKEIYEGDIIQNKMIKNEIYQVVFSQGSFCAYFPSQDYPVSLYEGGGEVIGNIFENPELLQQ